jgi:hypothetical protein
MRLRALCLVPLLLNAGPTFAARPAVKSWDEGSELQEILLEIAVGSLARRTVLAY